MHANTAINFHIPVPPRMELLQLILSDVTQARQSNPINQSALLFKVVRQ